MFAIYRFVKIDSQSASTGKGNGCCKAANGWGNVAMGMYPGAPLKFAVLFGVDALISITSFVIGLIGLLGVITMPAALSWTLVGISATITLFYLLTGSVRMGIGAVTNAYLQCKSTTNL